MSLADFMKQLQDQDASGIVYSQVPEQPVRVIPPEETAVKIIAPESKVLNPVKSTQPAKIKLKLERPNPQAPEQQIQPQIQVPANQTETEIIPEHIVQDIQNTIEKNEEPVPVAQLSEEELFIKSGTESSKKDIWLDYFAQAKASRKHNPVVDRMRLGKFTITPDNKVLILPDYDVVNKDPDDILKDSWF